MLDREFAETAKPMRCSPTEPTPVDAKKMANGFVRTLKHHLAEG